MLVIKTHSEITEEDLNRLVDEIMKVMEDPDCAIVTDYKVTIEEL